MRLRDFFQSGAINLSLKGNSKDEILRELVALLQLDAANAAIVLKMLKRREQSGSTGVGHGFAIPHCRFPGAHDLRVGYGRKAEGVDFAAIDQRPVHHFFLIVAPPLEGANLYLPVLGRIAEVARKDGTAERLRSVSSGDEFLDAISAIEEA
jgi:mannitol/fructose-specific phosphotransferase system IIA component (Ntr-type)